MTSWTSRIAVALVAALAQAQEPQTRAALIEREREAKAARLAPDEVSKFERRLRAFKDGKYLERFAAGYNGLRVKTGNMVTGGGFALGPEYFREDLWRGQMTARASAQLSTRGYSKFEAETKMPAASSWWLPSSAIRPPPVRFQSRQRISSWRGVRVEPSGSVIEV